MNARWKSYLVMSALFVFGVLAGGAATFTFGKREHAQMMRDPQSFHRKRRVRVLARRLDLNDQQQADVARILEQDAPKRRALMRETLDKCGEPMQKHKREIDADIRKVLQPEQVKKFDEIALLEGRRFFEEGLSPQD